MFRLARAKGLNYRRRRASNVITRDKVDLKGGLNFVDAADGIAPGMLLSARNYEPHYETQAYRRINGFEVFDGRARPHLAEYWKDGVETAIVVEYVVDAEAADDTGYMIVTDLTNDVDEGAVWTGNTSSATATAASGTEFEGQEDEDLHDQAQLAAEDYRRSFITEVGEGTCEGAVLGVHVYNNQVYAFRNEIGGAQCTMWRSTGAGWEQVTGLEGQVRRRREETQSGRHPDGRKQWCNLCGSACGADAWVLDR